jgi:uncharacterized protein YeaO (DUF488 family)
MSVEIRSKRIYDPADPADGARVLVDRIWPRGMAKDAATLALWLKEIAPSTALRQWFGHEPERWDEFCRRYREELDANGEAVRRLRNLAGEGRLTLLFAANDRERNNAVALADYLRLEERRDRPVGQVRQPSSPVCFAADADAAYRGYASRDEVVAFLNELLEAERAGAKATLRMAEGAEDPKLKTRVIAMHHDEAKWCAVLSAAIRRLRAEPSLRTGAFYEKVMAIGDLPGRLALLDRGQRWVARRLRDMLGRIEDGRLRADLAEMLAAHESGDVVSANSLG